ncbi:uncharacterized protein LOC135383799 [Ornithodoros turicata]|uniref:uncharacterized protein LOC135383799 n=1 Tax=Ornithodoros turicata TaxID=34597 RepID=UPI00313A33C5
MFGVSLPDYFFACATKVKFVPNANRILLAVWLISSFIIINLFNGVAKATLMAKSDVTRVESVDDILKYPKLRPITIMLSPFTTMLQISSLPVHQKLYRRMVEMRGELEVSEVFSRSTLEDVVQQKAVIIADGLTSRVQLSLFCNSLNGFFHVGSEPLKHVRSVYYARKDLNSSFMEKYNMRIRWLVQQPLPFLRAEELFPKGSTCFLDSYSLDRTSSYQALRMEDMHTAFIVLGFLYIVSFLFFGVEVTYFYAERILTKWKH